MRWWDRTLRRHLENELNKELSFHLDQHIADLVLARSIDTRSNRHPFKSTPVQIDTMDERLSELTAASRF
jgi:hypothetical protein